jgi:hypothetical protein
MNCADCAVLVAPRGAFNDIENLWSLFTSVFGGLTHKFISNLPQISIFLLVSVASACLTYHYCHYFFN